jgi:hypothetical protein
MIRVVTIERLPRVLRELTQQRLAGPDRFHEIVRRWGVESEPFRLGLVGQRAGTDALGAQDERPLRAESLHQARP